MDVAAFLARLDAILGAQEGPERAASFLDDALATARAESDRGGELTVLNELLGFLRVTGRHGETAGVADRALELLDELGAAGSEAGVTTRINAATALRAAGDPVRARELYGLALADAERTLQPLDRRLAALHNNLALLFSDLGDHDRAREELTEALAILRGGSTDRDRDIEIASTLVNLALARFASASGEAGEDALARAELAEALEVFDRVGAVDPHLASALAALGQAEARAGRTREAAAAYARALAIVEVCFGRDSDAYRVTAQNLAAVGGDAEALPSPASTPSPVSTASGAPSSMSGLDLSRAYWEAYGPDLLARFPDQAPRIAVGLVGHGSECYGFDDGLSRDHDFGPELCLWLTAEDHDAIGADLQAAYDALPREFLGFTRPSDDERTPRSRGANRRRGVFEIGAFFESITGYREAPPAERPHEWLMLPEATLAAATNGAVFRDQLGVLSATRQGFKQMPDDVRLALVSRRLGMIAQAGQYNVPRMIERGDGGAAWLAIAETASAAASLVFLVNHPARVGYLPYYKWQMAALRRLSGRLMARLPGVVDTLEDILRLASAACFPTSSAFPTPGALAEPAAAGELVAGLIEDLAAQVVADFRARRWTTSDETFLEWQRPHVEAAITTEWLRSL